MVGIFVPEVYETSLDLHSGRVWEKPIENPYRVSEMINGEPFLHAVRKNAGLSQTAHQLKEDGNVLARPVVTGKNPARQEVVMVRIVARGESPEEAILIVRTVADLIVARHKNRFDELIAVHSRFESELETQVQTIQKEVADLDTMIKGQREAPQVNAPAVILLQAQLEEKQSQLLSYIRELRDVKLNNRSKAFTEPTHVAFPPVLPEKPVNLEVIVTATLGVMIGLVPLLLVAFLVEYVGKQKNPGRISEESSSRQSRHVFES